MIDRGEGIGYAPIFCGAEGSMGRAGGSSFGLRIADWGEAGMDDGLLILKEMNLIDDEKDAGERTRPIGWSRQIKFKQNF
jgi:hypothetical protein